MSSIRLVVPLHQVDRVRETLAPRKRYLADQFALPFIDSDFLTGDLIEPENNGALVIARSTIDGKEKRQILGVISQGEFS